MVCQVELSGWEDSWKLYIAGTFDITRDEPTTSDISVPVRMNDVIVPGWRRSCFISASPPEEHEERQRSWSSCWTYRQQIRRVPLAAGVKKCQQSKTKWIWSLNRNRLLFIKQKLKAPVVSLLLWSRHVMSIQHQDGKTTAMTPSIWKRSKFI